MNYSKWKWSVLLFSVLWLFGGILFTSAAGQAPTAPQNNGPFVFPEDASGQELSKKLPPGTQGKLPRYPAAGKQPVKVPSWLENPMLLLTPPTSAIPHLPHGSTPLKTRPAAVPEEIPLADYAGSPVLPKLPKLDVGPLISVPSLDVHKPPVLVKVKDAAPDSQNLTDPTQEASHQAALKDTPPERTEPAAFLRLILPDPFANRQVATPAETLPEESIPVTVTPVLPGK